MPLQNRLYLIAISCNITVSFPEHALAPRLQENVSGFTN